MTQAPLELGLGESHIAAWLYGTSEAIGTQLTEEPRPTSQNSAFSIGALIRIKHAVIAFGGTMSAQAR
jgi:hypothetical protein